MDAVKFAFETTLVGLLALPWLALLLNFFLTRSQISELAENELLPKLREPTVMSIVAITVAYFMGSAVLPIATQLLDDQDTPLRKIREIRADLNGTHDSWFNADSALHGSNTPLSSAAGEFRKCCDGLLGPPSAMWQWPSRDLQKCWQMANDLFLIQQQLVLGEGTERIDRISRLYEQVIVLRGAVLNTFIFVSLCWFACFSPARHESLGALKAHTVMLYKALRSKSGFSSHLFELFKILMSLGLVGLLMFVSISLGRADVSLHDIRDPPIMETVLFVLGLLGIWGVLKGVEKGSYPFVTLLFSVALMLLAYGAWQWTEVLYTESVIAAFFARVSPGT